MAALVPSPPTAIGVVMKKCTKCNKLKDFKNFHKNKGNLDGYAYHCKGCRKEESLKQYNLTLQCYDKLVELQGNRCAICNTEEPKGTSTLNRWYVDHNHETGEVRGLLCSPCNTGLGNFYDNGETLRRAAEYLDQRGSYCEAKARKTVKGRHKKQN